MLQSPPTQDADQWTVSITHQWGQQLIAPYYSSIGFVNNWTLYVLSLCWASCRALPNLIMNAHIAPPYLHPSCLQSTAFTIPLLHLIHMNKQACRDATELNTVDSDYSPTYWPQDLTAHLSASDTGLLCFSTCMRSPLKPRVGFSSCFSPWVSECCWKQFQVS